MDSHIFLGLKKNGSYWQNLDEEDEIMKGSSIIPLIPQPETPMEPIEFLSRSWSLSADEISKAFAHKQRESTYDKYPDIIPETPSAQQIVVNPVNVQKPGVIGRWFHHKSSNNGTMKKKDKARIENAHIHASLSVAGLAAGLAAMTAAENSNGGSGSGSKMSMALSAATQLLASHCIEMAESAGADYERVASVVRSAVDIRTSSDLMTLVAGAATALRGEAALKARLPPKEAKRNAAITPCDKSMIEAEEDDLLPCIGDLLQHTQKGVLRWKNVSIYINKESQVIMKLKSKHVAGAFSKKNKCVVYEVCDEIDTWPFKKEKENPEVYFGVKTGRGLLEFKCKNKIHKQKWVDAVQTLLSRTSGIEEAERSFQFLNVNKGI